MSMMTDHMDGSYIGTLDTTSRIAECLSVVLPVEIRKVIHQCQPHR